VVILRRNLFALVDLERTLRVSLGHKFQTKIVSVSNLFLKYGFLYIHT
jgi:hypothetical protein